MSLGISSCSSNDDHKENQETKMDAPKQIMEVTSFNINEGVDATNFANRDTQVEANFTSKQPGFIKRQSGVDDKGNYVVVVFWESLANADSSMSHFMSDTSVADYGQMIDGNTMKMARYSMDKAFDAANSQFVEIMSFNLKPDMPAEKFAKLNHKVETAFTAKRDGFVKRLTGVNEEGTQVVAVYWENKEKSDASLQPFMEAEIAKKFMDKMDQTSLSMGRYQLLN